MSDLLSSLQPIICTLCSRFLQIGKGGSVPPSVSVFLSLRWPFRGIHYRTLVRVLQRNPKDLEEVLPPRLTHTVKLLPGPFMKWLLVEQAASEALASTCSLILGVTQHSASIVRRRLTAIKNTQNEKSAATARWLRTESWRDTKRGTQAGVETQYPDWE